MSEADWILRAQQGDIDAFERLVDAKKERVYWLAFRIIGNEEDAKDITQLVFIRLWKVIGRYRHKYSFDTWLYRITVNKSIDFYRKTASKASLVSPIGEPDRDVALSAPGGQESMQRTEEVSRIFRMLARSLSPKQRAVFVLKEIENVSTGEIARIMGLRQSTVRNHLFQARKILQDELRKRFPEYMPRRH